MANVADALERDLKAYREEVNRLTREELLKVKLIEDDIGRVVIRNLTEQRAFSAQYKTLPPVRGMKYPYLGIPEGSNHVATVGYVTVKRLREVVKISARSLSLMGKTLSDDEGGEQNEQWEPTLLCRDRLEGDPAGNPAADDQDS